MINVIIWDCTTNGIPLMYRLQVCNTYTIMELKVLIEYKRSECGRFCKKNFIIYYGSQLITDLRLQLLDFISDISASSMTFTIYDENYITFIIRIINGIGCGGFTYLPLVLNLFRRSIRIEILDQLTVGLLKIEIIKSLNTKKLRFDLNKLMILKKDGCILDDDSILRSIDNARGCVLDCIILNVFNKGKHFND